MRHFAIAAVATLFGLQSAFPVLGARLKAGMQLVYSSGGVDTPWSVVAANADTVVDGRRCLSLVLRLNPADTARTRRLQCAGDSVMHSWSASMGSLFPTRRLARGELITTNVTSGDYTQYVAAAAEADTIGRDVFLVIPTTVSTFDRTGKLLRRLRERFSIELATATCGVFEVPEGSGFRVERAFALAAVVNPGEIPPASSASRPSASPPTSKC